MDPALEPPSARSVLPDAQDGELPGRMDINRGPRRARHVAASLRATSERRTDNGDGNGNGNGAPPPPRGQHQQRLTPTNTAGSHRTPEQDINDAAPSHSGGRMPPVNPFRLHRASTSSFGSSPRIPLQDLPISPSGEVLGARCPTLRPIPCSGEENVSAFRDAMQSRYRYYTLQLADLTLQSLRLRHLEEQLRNEDSVLPANIMTNDAAALPHTRLSMPEISDDSDSEPDTSALGMARERLRVREGATQQAGLPPRFGVPSGRTAIPGQLQDTSIEDEDEDDEDEDLETVDDEEEEHEGEQEAEEMVPLIDPAVMGLKEISNLGRFTVSSHKQGNGVEELRSDDLNLYWQSDGPQPHNLTVYFVKRVEIRDLRFYVNYTDDESYTPTKIIFKSGTSENSLIEFAQLTLEQPLGWQQVSLQGAGGGPDGNTLVSYVLQMQILENHQNGKDTHLRGIKIYAFDADSAQGPGRENNPVDDMVEFIDGSAAARTGLNDEKERLSGLARRLAETTMESGDAGFSIPDFMRDPEIR